MITIVWKNSAAECQRATARQGLSRHTLPNPVVAGRRLPAQLGLRLLAIAVVSTALGLIMLPTRAWAGTWNVTAQLQNETGQTLSQGPQPPNLIDGQWGYRPGAPPATVTGTSAAFAFTAPNFDEGADAYADYQSANGYEWELTAEDDEGVGGGAEPAGNYVGCAEAAVQGAPGSNPVCAAEWGGTYENATPTYYFGTGATVSAAGEMCEATVTWPAVYSCTQGGLISPPDRHNHMELTFVNTGSQPTYVQDSDSFFPNYSNCRMQTAGSECTIITSGTGTDQILIGAVNQDSTTAVQLSVQIVAETDGSSIDNTGGLTIWQWQDQTPGGENSSVGYSSGWQIYPKIFNHTGSTSANCGTVEGLGCMQLMSYSLVDGDWTSSVLGGNQYLPSCSTGSSGCSDASFPYFDAPNFDEGADASWTYLAPDGNSFILGDTDNQNGVTDLNDYDTVSCSAGTTGSSSNQYVCATKFSPGGDSVNPLETDADFYPASAWATEPTAAGEVCVVPAGAQAYPCSAGDACNWTTFVCASDGSAGNGWGATDPDNYMLLEFADLSDAGSTVTVTDGGENPNVGSGDSCSLVGGGNCNLVTTGGTAASLNSVPA